MPLSGSSPLGRAKHSWPEGLGLILFASYPLALIPATTGVPFAFHIALPVFLWASMGTYLAILLNPPAWRHAPAAGSLTGKAAVMINGHYLVYAAAIALGLWITLSAMIGRTAEASSTVAVIGMFSVPAYFALAPRRWLPRNLIPVLALLWLLHVVYLFCQLVVGFEPVGLAGNRNWSATLTAVLCPWALLLLRRMRSRRPEKRPGRLAWLNVRNTCCAAVLALSLGVLWISHCRATWLLLGLYVIHSCWSYGRSRWLRLGPMVVAGAVLLTLLVYRPAPLTDAIDNDIRLPLYVQTVKMVFSRPFIGVGPGNFRREFVSYRSDAHKRRRVAAAVTEHPHNELLHLAATNGIPVALLWLAMGLVVIRRLQRRSGFWLATHFTAWVIVGHGMLDKVLVQPPTSLVGLMCLGLLWRPCCPWRLSCTLRPPGLGRVTPILWIVAALYLVVASVQTAITGYCFRAARLAEEEGHDEDAYRHYRISAQVNSADVRTHAYAGICANNRIRNPRLALEHLLHARNLEKDFAHLNGEIGLALGALGRHREAFPFFQREYDLFPYDLLALQRLYQCAIANGELSLLTPLYERLGGLRIRQATNQLSERVVQNLSHMFLDALKRGDPEASLAAANVIALALHETASDPGLEGMIPPGASFVAADVCFWKSRYETQSEVWRLPEDGKENAVLDLLAECAREGTREAMLRATQAAEAMGWEMARAVGSGRSLPDVVMIAEGHDRFLAFLPEGQHIERNNLKELVTALEGQVRKGPRTGNDIRRDWSIRVPAERESYLWKHQALAQVLGAGLRNERPFTVQSPVIRRAFWLEIVRRDCSEEHARPEVLPETL